MEEKQTVSILKATKDLFEKAKTDKGVLLALKNVAVAAQNAELGMNLREMEKEFFPETKEQKGAKGIDREVKTVLAMCDIRIENPGIGWVIFKAMKAYIAGENFSIKHSSKITEKRKQLFNLK